MPNNQKQSAPEKYIFCANQLKTTQFKAPNGRLLKWRMKMFPNGKDEQFRDYVGLSLSFIGDSNSEEVEAKFWISIRKSDAEEVKLRYFHHKFGPTWENAEMIARKDLFNFRNGYLSGDRLTIVCKLVVLQESIGKAPDIEVPESRVPEDVGYLFEKSLFPDCKITSEDDKEFKVHKCILGCRSPVFAAMFEHEMLEKNSNIIDISDMKGKVIEAMLRFIYSGKEPDLDVGMAEDLLIAAEKYELIRLKLICERKLINSLANGNACEFLVLANLHSAKHLKAKAIDFIKMHGNEILESEEWKTLANEELKDQILKAILAK